MIIGDAFVPLALINCWGGETVQSLGRENLLLYVVDIVYTNLSFYL